MPKYKIIISGGGTGGHVYPAIAIANELKKNDVDILFVGARHKLEMKKVPEAGFNIIGLPIMGLQRRITYKNILFGINLIKSLIKSKKIIKDFKPNMAIGVGGYASAPIVYIASKRNIPTLLQEQNSYAGITNKLLAKRADKICVAYEGMDNYFPKDKIVFTGNPIRSDLTTITEKEAAAFEYFGLTKKRKTLLVLGGSLGARTINESILEHMDVLKSQNMQVVWQTGKTYFDKIYRLIKDSNLNHVVVKDFIDRMDYAYAASDLIISRAGAIAISEICFVGKPCILVPSPNVTEDHQTKNAMALVEKKAALLVKNARAIETLLPTAIKLISNEKKLQELKQNITPLGVKDATKRIVKEVFKILER